MGKNLSFHLWNTFLNHSEFGGVYSLSDCCVVFLLFFFVKVRPLFPYPRCGPGATDTQKGCHWFTAPFMHDYKVTPPLSQISGNYKQRLQYVSPTIVATSIPCGMGHSTLVGTSSMGGTLQVQAENLSGSVLPFQEVMTPSTHTHTHTTPNSHFTTIQPPQGCPALAVVPSWTLLLSSYLDSQTLQESKFTATFSTNW